MQQPRDHHLAQLNIGRLRYEVDDPRIAINLSVWESVEALERFVYLTLHKRFYARRSEWFDHFDGPYFVMWRVPAGHRPSVEEAVARLDHLKEHGTSDYAFDWQTACARRMER